LDVVVFHPGNGKTFRNQAVISAKLMNENNRFQKSKKQTNPINISLKINFY